MALSDTKLRTLKAGDRAFSESDGGGLFVEVMPAARRFGGCATASVGREPSKRKSR